MPQRRLHRTIVTHRFFGDRKNIHRENCTHRLHHKKYHFFGTQTLYPEQFLHSRNSFAQKPLRTDFFCNQCTAIFTENCFSQKIFRTDVLRTEGFTHNTFFIQTFFTFYTDAFAQQSNCTQKLVHTAHFYTQPVFAQRGSASPSSSPTFRVPPFQVAFTYQLAETHTQPCMQISAPLHVHGYVVMHNASMYGHSAHVFCAGVGARFTIFTWSTAEIMELPMVTPSGHSYDFTSIVPHPGTELKLHDQPRQNHENMTRYCI